MDELNNNLLEAAKKYLSMGFSVIPVGEGKMPTIQWKEFQTRKATRKANSLPSDASGTCRPDHFAVQSRE